MPPSKRSITCPGVTEFQAGGLIFMDAFYRHRCHVTEFDFALKLITTVVSRPAPDRAIIDAGRKSQYADSHPPLVVGREGVRLVRLSAEHGQLELDEANRDLGDRPYDHPDPQQPARPQPVDRRAHRQLAQRLLRAG